jgi:transglutaminase-like putative cysteine protease
MRVAITHRTRLDYSQEVVEGVMDTRLGPLSDAHQRWERHELQIAPAGSIRSYVDAFGNSAALLTVPRPHRFVEVTASGRVETLLQDPFALPSDGPRPLSPAERFDYLQPSRLVALPDGVRDLAEPHRPPHAAGTLDAVRALMDLVYRTFTYRKDVTTVSTTVGDLLASRSGVCQDFAHVLIAMCRSIDIPARYVSGYIVSRQAPGRAAAQSQGQSQAGSGAQGSPTSVPAGTAAEPPPGPPRGAGASHAWIEAYTPTHGWLGFDPTNNLLASESHVKMAIGRDYGDVAPTRGTFRGSATETLLVEVSVLPQGGAAT